MSHQQWPSSLCNVCAAGPVACMVAFACPCVQFGLNNDKLRRVNGLGESGCVAACKYAAFLAIPMYCLLHSDFRGEVRQLEQIESRWDGCVTCFCAPCALVQEAALLDTALRSLVVPPGHPVAPVSPVRVSPIPPSPQPCNAPQTPQSVPHAAARFPSPQVAVSLASFFSRESAASPKIGPSLSTEEVDNPPEDLSDSSAEAEEENKPRKSNKKKNRIIPFNIDVTPSKLPRAKEVKRRPAQPTNRRNRR